MDIADLFLQSFPKDFKSKGEVRRAIKNNGLRINDIKVEDPFARFEWTKLGNHIIGVLLENNETIITSFCDLEVIKNKEKFDGWPEPLDQE